MEADCKDYGNVVTPGEAADFDVLVEDLVPADTERNFGEWLREGLDFVLDLGHEDFGLD
jgi:hypothetical protein